MLVAIQLFGACSAYKRDLMFQLSENRAEIEAQIQTAEMDYVLEINDLVRLDVFTNAGEFLLDPQFELLQGGNPQVFQFKDRFTYFIQEDSTARFPQVGNVQLAGLTLQEAEVKLEEAYAEYFVKPFVRLRLANRRVTVLGAVGEQATRNGGGGAVVPLVNENMRVPEVLALAGGVGQGGRVQSIRLIRGNLSNPQIYEIDLGTIAGMKQSQMTVQGGDILYVEPWRRPFNQTVRDLSPILSLITSVATLIIVINNVNRNDNNN